MKNIFVILDGLGYDQVVKFEPPELIERSKNTGLKALETLLAYSSGIYPAIWTGLYPDQTNFWMEFIYKERSRSLIQNLASVFPGKYFPRKVSFITSIICQKLDIEPSYHYGIPPSIQNHFERVSVEYKNLPPLALPFSELITTVFTGKGRNLKYIHCEILNKESITAAFHEMDNADTVIFCVAETDHAGHTLGPLSENYGTFLYNLDNRLASFFHQIEARWPDIHIHIFSDHGMTQVERSFDLWSYLEKHNLHLGKEYLTFINSTLASFWFKNSNGKKIVDLLNQSGMGHVLTKNERIKYHLDFHDKQYGDEIFVANEGIELVPNFISLSWKPNLGMHGYEPILKSTNAFYIGHEVEMENLSNVVDIYKIIRKGAE